MPAARYQRSHKTTPHTITGFEPPARGADPELDAVEDLIKAEPNVQARFGEVLRTTFDQLYDGQHTGRYRVEELRKTEKTHMGTLVEINMQREFDWADGTGTDYKIADIDVDCKFSMRLGGWAVPIEAREEKQILLVIWANEDWMRWEAGLIRVANDSRLFNLDAQGNRDGKRELTAEGESQIRWLFPGAKLPPNQLLHLDPGLRAEIFATKAPRGNRHGQARINMLCRRVQNQILMRGTILTIAQQDDSLKRPRDSRLHLRSEGVIVLGHQQSDPLIAAALGLPVPRKGQFISTRVVPADLEFEGPVSEIAGTPWREATDADPVVEAPKIPRKQPGGEDVEIEEDEDEA